MNKKNAVIGILFIIVGVILFQFAPTPLQIDEFLKPFGRSPVVLVLRDLVVASYAHIKAGDDIPYDIVYGVDEVAWNKVDYGRMAYTSVALTWDLQTNSVWVADQVRIIVPFFYYEGILEIPLYPREVVMIPYPESKSFHILGDARSIEGIIRLNERFFMENNRRDLRQVLSTMVHELIHIQGGAFSGWVEEVGVDVEPRTQAATIEVLAGMCHYRNDVACNAFWSEIEGYARGSLLMRLRMYGHEEWYDKIANLLWRDSEDILARNKSLRHWMDDESLRSQYYNIINDYQKVPWEQMVVEGLCGKGLETGFMEETIHSTPEHPQWVSTVMNFDDARSMFGEGLISMICNLPHGPGVY